MEVCEYDSTTGKFYIDRKLLTRGITLANSKFTIVKIDGVINKKQQKGGTTTSYYLNCEEKM